MDNFTVSAPERVEAQDCGRSGQRRPGRTLVVLEADLIDEQSTTLIHSGRRRDAVPAASTTPLLVQKLSGSVTLNWIFASCSGAEPILRRKGSQRRSFLMLAKRPSDSTSERPDSSICTALSSHSKA